MSNSSSSPTTGETSQNPPSPKARRPSFSELFASRPPVQRPQPSSMSAAISQQAQEAQRTRRLSTTTLGLSGSPTHTSTPFGALRRGAGSISEGSGAGVPVANAAPATEETAIEESGSLPPIGEAGSGSKAESPARRISFGARAYGVARSASLSYSNSSAGSAAGLAGGSVGNGAGGTAAPNNGISQTATAGIKKDGYDFGENLRSRAERASISGQPGSMGGVFGHNRTRSQASENMAPAPPPAPPVTIQKTPPKPNVPDHFQERILKGDFYMD